MKRQIEAKRAEQQNSDGTSNRNAADFLRQQIANEQSPLHAALANLGVLLGFVAFAFAVKYVLKNLA